MITQEKLIEALVVMVETMGMFSHDLWAIKYGTEGPYSESAYSNNADAMRELLKEERDRLRAELNEAEKLIPHICYYCKKNIVGSAAKFCKKQAEDGIHSGAYTCGEWEWCGKGAGNG